MPRNLELKAVCRSRRAASEIARQLTGRKGVVLRQTDTYFDIPGGRLKLREVSGASSELIRYQRLDRFSERISDYVIVKTRRPREVLALFRKVFGILVVVRKERLLYRYKNARIHLDRVAGLGDFLEFEVIVRKGIPQASTLMKFLKDTFGIRRTDLIPTSYSTLRSDHRRKK